MARYIDADELRRRVKEKTNPYGKPTLDYESGVKVLNMIDNAPTADVVPKSEVLLASDDAIRKLLELHAYSNEQYEKIKTEVAREIFEEIEGTLIDSKYIPDCAKFIDMDRFAELKKKYTEEVNGSTKL